MDLRIVILDENREILEDVTVYQDGSDREGAAEIVGLIGAVFTLEKEDGDED